jgi:glutamate synthase domain-containing protein 1/glutamate synthase domain-containing protein 3
MDAYAHARRELIAGIEPRPKERTAEGGCGVIGLASTIPLSGKHIVNSVTQMSNRGNGKGGGLALAGCFPEHPAHYALNVGLLSDDAREAVEGEFIEPYFDVTHVEAQPQLDDHRALALEVRPPQVMRYFVRVRPEVLSGFAERHGFDDLQAAEDEFVYQNSFRLNRALYADRDDDKLAFVLSHGRNMMILKAVGYAQDIARYYCLEEQTAYVWIGHQRYPTRGRVWHPGGAHPYAGLDEALVHNGDFANYRSVTTYLRQRGYVPLFLTDTEVAVLLFDLYKRIYGYPLEYVIEAIAPTTELDFVQLPPEKREVYAAIQAAHLHGSPDGPWFFIIARHEAKAGAHQLIGITDTSMLRPQVFALQEGVDRSGTPFGLAMVASEKQAIDAAFQSISCDHPQVCPVPDRVWAARGGSHEDGGAFMFNVTDAPENGHKILQCTDKFGHEITTERNKFHADYAITIKAPASAPTIHPADNIGDWLVSNKPGALFEEVVSQLASWTFHDLEGWAEKVVEVGSRSRVTRRAAIKVLTLLNDRHYPTGSKKRSAILAIVRGALDALFADVPGVASAGRGGDTDRLLTWESRHALVPPSSDDARLYIDAHGLPLEGDASAARAIVAAYQAGWRHIIVFGCAGHRFLGSGLGRRTDGARIDVYGSSGDYLGSGLDGAEIHVHGDAQDQVGQILVCGKLVIHGNVGQTLLYGAKGGVCYVLGNAAGRPIVNAVGGVRAVIYGTCLDYAAESFMAGPTTGGGFVCINGLTFGEDGRPIRLEQPYPGGNFFSLASGGAGYLNDPHRTLHRGQLNGAALTRFTEDDWEVLLPYLEESAALFGISVETLLTLDGEVRHPREIYRKVVPVHRKLTERGE